MSRIVVAALALMAILMFLLSRLPLFPYGANLRPGHADATLFKVWAYQSWSGGFADIFRNSDTNYVGYHYLLWPVAALYGRMNPDFQLDTMTLHYLIKAPPVLFDLLAAVLVFAVARWLLTRTPSAVPGFVRRWRWLPALGLSGEDALAAAAAALFAFHPAVIYDSAVWAQTDSIITFFELAAIFALARGRTAAAGFLFAVGFVMKPQPVVILPALAAFTWWRFGWRGALDGVAGCLAGLTLLLGFFVLHGDGPRLVAIYRGLFTPSDEYLSLAAWNVWWFSDIGTAATPRYPLLAVGGATLRIAHLALLLTGAATLVALAYLRRRTDAVGLLVASAYLVFVFYMLPLSTHERYLYPLFGLLAPVAVVERRWLPLYLFLTPVFALNLFAAAPTDPDLVETLLVSRLSFAMTALNIVAFLAVTASLGWAAVAPFALRARAGWRRVRPALGWATAQSA
ncbi:MAG TPA: glycosyltransferase 87 family protein [Dehalococcoidia bacterium]|nr:glycosyltransferase 87 family protein [Dehalococcoidia bacterium]